MKPSRLELHSPYPPAECAARLSAAIDLERSALFSFAAFFDGKPVLGRVTDSSIHLRKRIGYRNSFQSFFAGEMRPEESGTLLTGKFAMHSFVLGFMALWFGFLLLVGGGSSIVPITRLFSGAGMRDGKDWLGLVVPAGMAFFGVMLVALGRYLARNEAPFITDFLVRTLDATPNAQSHGRFVETN